MIGSFARRVASTGVVCLLVACGGSASEVPSEEGQGRSVASPSTSSAPSTSPTASSPTAPSAPTASAEPAASPSGAGLCAPDARCGGLTSCSDNCFGTKCCFLSCSCSSGNAHDANAFLQCTLSACSK